MGLINISLLFIEKTIFVGRYDRFRPTNGATLNVPSGTDSFGVGGGGGDFFY